MHRFSGGVSTNRWNITLFVTFYLSCHVLYFSFQRQFELRDRYSRFMAQTTWCRKVLRRLGRWVTLFEGKCAPKPQKGHGWAFLSQTRIIIKLTYLACGSRDFRQNLASWKIEKSPYLGRGWSGFDDIWQGDPVGSSGQFRPWKIKKSPHVDRDWSDLVEIWHSEAVRPF